MPSSHRSQDETPPPIKVRCKPPRNERETCTFNFKLPYIEENLKTVHLILKCPLPGNGSPQGVSGRRPSQKISLKPRAFQIYRRHFTFLGDVSYF